MSGVGNVVTIKQLAHRLESSSSNERVDALTELQSFARTSPDLVGEHALLKAFQLLREHSSPEEYCEVLDLVLRLVKCRNKDIAKENSRILLENKGDHNNIELLLDLLEHSDLTVGVMTSQILTELHGNDGKTLEEQIQACPDAMFKLLQRLPDSSREEVRNQSIVLLQELTKENNQMKTTVVFNEGFEILFKIILEEGGFGDAGIVVADCLKICQNILNNSEICQKVFFQMGNEWIIRLAEFFNPLILERMNRPRISSALSDENDTAAVAADPYEFWFEDKGQLQCAISAMNVLINSLMKESGKAFTLEHQNYLLDRASIVLNYSSHWIARGGPVEILNPSFSLLLALILDNPRACQLLSQLNIKVFPNILGKNIPSAVGVAGSLEYGWKPLANDEMKYISFLSLIAERYVFPVRMWKSTMAVSSSLSASESEEEKKESLLLEIPLFAHIQGGNEADTKISFERACLLLFEKIISCGDTAICDLIVQSILAPPPQPLDDNSEVQPLEMMKPLGLLLVSSLIDLCEKLHHSNQQFGGSNPKHQSMLEATERSIQLLTDVYLNGSQVAKELTTMITVNHIKSMKGSGLSSSDHHHDSMKPFLPYILASIGRAARLPGGVGYNYVVAILQLLSVMAFDCETATHQMFEDPSNLFVVDLATQASELAGVPVTVQVMACLFLGCCFTGLPEEKAPDSGNPNTHSGDEGLFHRHSFLTMIDKRISVTRYLEILKKPLQPKKPSTSAASSSSSHSHVSFEILFALPGFKVFYEKQIEIIRKIILELFYGASQSMGNLSSDAQQLISMQQEKIKDLESKLAELSLNERGGGVGGSSLSVHDGKHPPSVPHTSSLMLINEENERKIAALVQEVQEKEKLLAEQHEKLLSMASLSSSVGSPSSSLASAAGNSSSSILIEELKANNEELEGKIRSLKNECQTKEMIEKSLRSELLEVSEEMESVKRFHTELELVVMSSKHKLIEKDNEIHSLTRLQESLENENSSLNEKVVILEDSSKQLSESYKQLMKEYEEFRTRQQSLSSSQPSAAPVPPPPAVNHLHLSEEEHQKLLSTITDQQNEMIELQHQLSSFNKELNDKEDLIVSLKEKFLKENKEKESLAAVMNENASKILLYEQELKQLKASSSSSAAVPASSSSSAAVANDSLVQKVNDLTRTLQEKDIEIATLTHDQEVLSEGMKSVVKQIHDFEWRSLDLYEKILDPLNEQVIIFNLNDGIAEEERENDDDDDLERHGDELMNSYCSSNLQTIKQLLTKTNQLRQHHPHRQQHASFSLEAMRQPQWMTSLSSLLDLPFHYQFYEKLFAILQDNNQIVESLAAKCSDYAEGMAAVSSLDGSEGSLLRVLDCCKQLNHRCFELTNLSDNYSQLLTSFEELQGQCTELSERNQSLEETNEELQQEIASYKQTLSSSSSSLQQQMVSLRTSYEEKLTAKQERMDEFSQQMMSLNQQLRELSEQISLKESTIQEQKIRYETASVHHSREMQELKDRLVASEETLRTVTTNNEDLQLHVKTSQGQGKVIQELKEEIARLEEKLRKSSSGEALVAKEYQEQITVLANQVSSLTSELNHEKTLRNEEKNELLLKNVQLQEELDSATERFEDEKENLLLDSSKKIVLFQNEFNEFREALATLEEEKEALQNELKALEKEKTDRIKALLEKSHSYEVASKDWKEKLAHLMEEKETLKKDFEQQLVKEKEQLKSLLVDFSEKLSKGFDDITSNYLLEISFIPFANEKFPEFVANLTANLKKLSERLFSLSKEKDLLEEQVKEKESLLFTLSQENTEKDQLYLETMENKEKKYQSLLEDISSINQQESILSNQLTNDLEKKTEEISLLKHELMKYKQHLSHQQEEFQKILSNKEEEMKKLKESNYLQSSIQVQQQEMKRISAANEKHVKELTAKDTELKEIKNVLSSKTGEIEGLKITIKDLKEDIVNLQQEIRELNDSNELYRKQLRQTQLFPSSAGSLNTAAALLSSSQEMTAIRNKSSSQDDERKYSKVLQNIRNSLERSSMNSKSNNYGSNGSNGFTAIRKKYTSDEHIDVFLEEILQQYEKEIQQLSSNLSSATRTPLKAVSKSPSVAPATFLSPIVKTSPNSNELFGSKGIESSPKTMSKSLIASSSSSSSSGSTSRLANEVLTKERKRYSQLEEQHTELLSLLAQQEVELQTFKEALSNEFGEEKSQFFEDEAQKKVIDMYGSYTNYRQYA